MTLLRTPGAKFGFSCLQFKHQSLLSAHNCWVHICCRNKWRTWEPECISLTFTADLLHISSSSSVSILKQSLQSVPAVLCTPHTLTTRYQFLRPTNWWKYYLTRPGMKSHVADRLLSRLSSEYLLFLPAVSTLVFYSSPSRRILWNLSFSPNSLQCQLQCLALNGLQLQNPLTYQVFCSPRSQQTLTFWKSLLLPVNLQTACPPFNPLRAHLTKTSSGNNTLHSFGLLLALLLKVFTFISGSKDLLTK